MITELNPNQPKLMAEQRGGKVCDAALSSTEQGSGRHRGNNVVELQALWGTVYMGDEAAESRREELEEASLGRHG